MNIQNEIILTMKYIVAVGVIVVIVLAPVWLARQNKRNKTDSAIVRISCWLFGWTGVGWLFALFWGCRK